MKQYRSQFMTARQQSYVINLLRTFLTHHHSYAGWMDVSINLETALVSMIVPFISQLWTAFRTADCSTGIGTVAQRARVAATASDC